MEAAKAAAQSERHLKIDYLQQSGIATSASSTTAEDAPFTINDLQSELSSIPSVSNPQHSATPDVDPDASGPPTQGLQALQYPQPPALDGNTGTKSGQLAERPVSDSVWGAEFEAADPKTTAAVSLDQQHQAELTEQAPADDWADNAFASADTDTWASGSNGGSGAATASRFDHAASQQPHQRQQQAGTDDWADVDFDALDDPEDTSAPDACVFSAPDMHPASDNCDRHATSAVLANQALHQHNGPVLAKASSSDDTAAYVGEANDSFPSGKAPEPGTSSQMPSNRPILASSHSHDAGADDVWADHAFPAEQATADDAPAPHPDTASSGSGSAASSIADGAAVQASRPAPADDWADNAFEPDAAQLTEALSESPQPPAHTGSSGPGDASVSSTTDQHSARNDWQDSNFSADTAAEALRPSDAEPDPGQADTAAGGSISPAQAAAQQPATEEHDDWADQTVSAEESTAADGSATTDEAAVSAQQPAAEADDWGDDDFGDFNDAAEEGGDDGFGAFNEADAKAAKAGDETAVKSNDSQPSQPQAPTSPAGNHHDDYQNYRCHCTNQL